MFAKQTAASLVARSIRSRLFTKGEFSGESPLKNNLPAYCVFLICFFYDTQELPLTP